MKKVKYLLIIIGLIQIVLGLLSLFSPEYFVSISTGLINLPQEANYPLGMLASRFLVFGFLFIYISNKIQENKLLVNAMISIQIIDLLVGIYYTSVGIVPMSASGFPMFNAIWISLLLFLSVRRYE